MYNFLLKILQGDQGVLNLLHGSNKGDQADKDLRTPPKYIIVEKYKYKFNTKSNGEQQPDGDMPAPYWIRERAGKFFPRQGVATVEMLENLVGQ